MFVNLPPSSLILLIMIVVVNFLRSQHITITCTQTAISVTNFAIAKVVTLMASGDVGVSTQKVIIQSP